MSFTVGTVTNEHDVKEVVNDILRYAELSATTKVEILDGCMIIDINIIPIRRSVNDLRKSFDIRTWVKQGIETNEAYKIIREKIVNTIFYDYLTNGEG